MDVIVKSIQGTSSTPSGTSPPTVQTVTRLVTQTAPSVNDPNRVSPGPNVAVAAGVGVGVGVPVCIAMGAGLAFYFFRRVQNPSSLEVPEDRGNDKPLQTQHPTELHAEHAELESTAMFPEFPSSPTR